MKYYKFLSGEYIMGISDGGNGGIEITESEYNKILSAIQNRPAPEPGYGFRLKTDLTYERYEMPEAEPEELTAEEALDIILGGDGE